MSEQRLCDNCNQPIEVRGFAEPEYVHYHGSVFCMIDKATYDGHESPTREVAALLGLITKLGDAAETLHGLERRADAVHESARLHGKRTGVLLARDYAERALKEIRRTDG